MDRLTEYARSAIDEYRERLNPRGPRVERDWASIERRALAELEAAGEFAGTEAAAGRWGSFGMGKALAVVLGVACVGAAVAWRPWADTASLEQGHAAPAEAVYHARASDEPQPTTKQDCSTEAHREMTCPAVAPVVLPAPPEASPEEASAPARTPRVRREKKARSEPAPRTTAQASHSAIQEIAAIRRARAALRDGDGAAALRALDEYAREFGAGEFAEEATVLRMTALCRLGRVAAGQKLQRTFLATRPRSPLAGQAAHACEPSSSE